MDNIYVHCVSVNIRGLRDRVKRGMIHNWIKRQKIDICFLQETFLNEELEKLIKKEWDMEIISSFGTAHSKGVTIVYDKNIRVKVENQHITDDGRRLMMNLEIQNISCTLINLYAPTNYKDRKEI